MPDAQSHCGQQQSDEPSDSAETKAKLVQAAALRNTDLTNFVTQTVLREAETVIEKAKAITLSERDYKQVLQLLENPPAPNDRLQAAIGAVPPLA